MFRAPLCLLFFRAAWPRFSNLLHEPLAGRVTPFVWTGPVWDTSLQPLLKCSSITAAGKVRSSKTPHPCPWFVCAETTSGSIYTDPRQSRRRYGEAGLGGKGLQYIIQLYHYKREGDHVEAEDGGKLTD
jgi:hypothetical protein